MVGRAVLGEPPRVGRALRTSRKVGRAVLGEPPRVGRALRTSRKVGRAVLGEPPRVGRALLGEPPRVGRAVLGEPRLGGTPRPTCRPTCLPSGRRIECHPIGPFVLQANQPLADWILTNVMPFFGKLALIPDAVLKAIALKANACRLPQESLPRSTSRPAVSGRKRRKHVQMIRHDKKKVQKPSSMFVVESRCVEYLFDNNKKRLSASFRRIDRYKLDNGALNRKRRQPVRKFPTYR